MTSSISDKETERRELALRCASNGIPVVPWHGTRHDVCTCGDEYCLTPGDHPRVNEGTTDPEVVKEHWKKWPQSKAAVATGTNIIAVKLKLIGADQPEEPWSRRPHVWAELEKKEGLPRTVTFHTKRHDVLLFTVPEEDVPIGRLTIEEGVIVYGAGEYFQLPQNFSSNGKVAFQPTCAPGEVPIAPAPDWVRRMIIFRPLRDGSIGATPRSIPFEWIEYPGEVDDERVKLYAKSLQVTSIRTLLYVRFIKESHFALLSDPHELAALELIGLTSALCIVLELDDIDAELWQLAQVLNQPKLSVLDWAEAIMRWVELVKQKAEQGACPLGGFQPHDKGFKRAGRVLGVSRRAVERASVIASICAEAKAEIRTLNLNVKRKLLAIGAEPEELQLAKLYELTRDPKSESADEADGAGSEPGHGGEQDSMADHEPGGSLGQAAASHAVDPIITLNPPGNVGARQSEADQKSGDSPPEAGKPEGTPAAPAIAAALIESPTITADPSEIGDDSGPDFSQDLVALDRSWDQHSMPIYDRLPDELRRYFIERKLGYLVVSPDSVGEGHAEAGPRDEGGA